MQMCNFCRACNGGKTTLAEKLQENFSPVTIIHQDDWYKVFLELTTQEFQYCYAKLTYNSLCIQARENVPVSEDGKELLWDGKCIVFIALETLILKSCTLMMSGVDPKGVFFFPCHTHTTPTFYCFAWQKGQGFLKNW